MQLILIKALRCKMNCHFIRDIITFIFYFALNSNFICVFMFTHRTNPELLLNPVVIARNEQEKVLIEGSINSVRISVRVRKSDELDQLIAHKFMRFLMQRAESFIVLRRKPIAGYDISFLVTNVHTEMMHKHKIVDFIIQFISDIDAELANMKFVISCRANAAANTYLRSFI